MSQAGRYKPRKKLTVQCHICSDPFEATRPDARYCSATCRSVISRAMRAVKGTIGNRAGQGAIKK